MQPEYFFADREIAVMHNRFWIASAAALGMLSLPIAAVSATATRSVFGTMPDGRQVDAVTLTNNHKIKIRLLALGARVQSIDLPGRDGKVTDVALGYPTLEGYIKKPQYFGATVGRYANRIAKGTFSLNGKVYHIPINDAPNALHGGPKGFSTRLWTVVDVKHTPTTASVTFQYVSPNGDMGFPGKLIARATFTLNDKDQLRIDYRATTNKPTIVNMSNHTYWNLGGEGSGSVMKQVLRIPADAYTPTDKTQIPTGRIVPVAGTPFDFRKPKPIGQDIRDGHEPQLVLARGYDENWVIGRHATKSIHLMACAEDPKTGRVLTMSSNQPGLQFYSGNFLNGTTVGTSGHIYRQTDAFVLEPQDFPDAPNHTNFPSAVLDPGQTYHNEIIDQFSTEPVGHDACASVSGPK